MGLNMIAITGASSEIISQAPRTGIDHPNLRRGSKLSFPRGLLWEPEIVAHLPE
jgi:hypothetical protein